MIAFDTNVLVRLLVQDDPDQFATALDLLGRAAERAEPCFLADGVLCETEWVLQSCYAATRGDVLAALRGIADDARYTVADPEALEEALAAYEEGKGELADHLIGVRSRRAGARTTYTFDRKLKERPDFTCLS